MLTLLLLLLYKYLIGQLPYLVKKNWLLFGEKTALFKMLSEQTKSSQFTAYML
jgi:hypothetical protein